MPDAPRLIAITSLAVGLLSFAQDAQAVCSNSTSLKSWGDFWVERNTSGQCFFYAQQYPCGATGGTRTPGTKTLLATVGSADPAKNCEDLVGYDTALATVLSKYAPGGAGFYECDASFVDSDQDGVASCIDANDTDPRVWVASPGNETVCDGVDNDGDLTVDDGFTACAKDYKRQNANHLYQGEPDGRVNLITGALLRSETDATIEGPYGPLSFGRTFNSARTTNDSSLGNGWVHNFSVYLKQMPAGDDRWQVQTPSGEMQYFRCTTFGTSMSCAVDDHQIAGNLRRVAGQFQYYPGDGTVWLFEDTVKNGRRALSEWKNGSNQRLALATVDANGRPTKIETANAARYFSLVYDGSGNLDLIRINSAASNTILDYSVASSLLTQVTFSSDLGSLDTHNYLKYAYDAGSTRLRTVKSKIDTSATEITLAEYFFDGSGRVTTLADATKNLGFSYASGATTVTYNVLSGGGNPSSVFTHNGLWVTNRNSAHRVGGMAAATQVYDSHGRITCLESDDSRTTKLIYGDSTAPTRADFFGKSSDCVSGGVVDHRTWMAYEVNGNVQALRPVWSRRTSVYSGAADCSGVSLPANCSEVKYQYVSGTDDRIQWVTQTGYTKLLNDTTQQQMRKSRYFYFGLDTGTCASSGDWYTGLLCQDELQDNGAVVYERNVYTYHDSGQGLLAGLPKQTRRHDMSADPAPLTTLYSAYNAFGTPTTVVDEAGVTRTMTYNGWNAMTSMVDTNALLDDALPPVAFSLTTSNAYNKLRRLDTKTLPKGNKRIWKYSTGAGGYGRVLASANAGSDSSLQEIMRYEYDQFGSRTEEKVIDSLVGTTPCTDETCLTWEVRRAWSYNPRRQQVDSSLYASNTATPDATTTNVYALGQLTSSNDYDGTVTSVTYDDQGRVSQVERDDGGGGLNAVTGYGYDAAGQLLTTTSPTGVVTRTERDDFGQLVLERSPTRGDIRMLYDPSGFVTERQRFAYNSLTTPDRTCYSRDWLGRQKTLDYACNGVDWNFYYDGDSMPSGACRAGTVQTGRLSMFSKVSSFARVLCYHPNGMLYASTQMNETSTWNNTTAKGTTLIYDANGNLSREYIFDRPADHTNARVVEYTYDASLLDRVKSIRHKLNSAGSWTDVTSPTTSPTYFPFGGFKTVLYANDITETNTRDKAYRLTRRRSERLSTKFTDINLTYDVDGSITGYDDSTGYRHLQHYAAYDRLNRIRCVSRAPITSCAGSEPWENRFLESFDYDLSGNRTNRRSGAYNSSDDDAYSYVAGTDTIDFVVSGGTTRSMDNSSKGEITRVNQPNQIDYTFNAESQLTNTNDTFLGTVVHNSTPFMDRYSKVSTCNSRKNFFHYFPGPGGAGSQLQLMSLWNTCLGEYPRSLRSYIYLEGRPFAVVHSTIAAVAPGDAQTDVGTFWVHTDQLGTPVLVTSLTRTERWRWENDPFGRADPVEYTVSPQDVSPDDSSGNPYNTCCCTSCGVSGCGTGTNGCFNGCCAGGTSQAQVWTKTYTPGGANNVRLHFSSFDVKPGATSRTGKDYLQYVASNGTTVLANLTGDLGDFWGPWSGGASVKINFITDNLADGTKGWVVDKLEYTTTANGRFVMHLRMPGQIADQDAEAFYNWNRWYRNQDGRYISPDPIGLAGGEAGYSAYVGNAPVSATDPNGLGPTICTDGGASGIGSGALCTGPGGAPGCCVTLQGPTGTFINSWSADECGCCFGTQFIVSMLSAQVRNQFGMSEIPNPSCARCLMCDAVGDAEARLTACSRQCAAPPSHPAGRHWGLLEFRRRYGTRSSISADTLLGRFSYTAPEDDDEDEDEESELPSLRLPR